jgi:hypothetical protein
VIAQLEHLLGARAREVVSPPAADYPHLIGRLGARGAVVQYSCPDGIRPGKPLYTVWAAPGSPPSLTRTVLSAAAAGRVALLSGERLGAGGGAEAAPADGAQPEASGGFEARGLGLDVPGGDPAAVAQARRLAQRTLELWAALDRGARADGAVGEVAAALFPEALTAWLAGAADPAAGLPPHLLVVPGAHLWNLPWAGLVATADGRRLVELARVSLAPSLSCLDTAAQAADPARPARQVTAWIPACGPAAVAGTGAERAMVGAMFGTEALAATPDLFLEGLGAADAAIASVHGSYSPGLSHGVFLTAGRCLTAADLIALDLPAVLVIGSCWSSRVASGGEPFALPLIAHARGAVHVIGGVYPLPDAAPFPTARLLTQLYPALAGTDPATALWLAQNEAHAAGAPPRAWAGLTHSTTRWP